jgi:cellulose synthase/poly-beta-1,6-N-acetylglucosamine synthase-like glycosyltransferase
LREAKDFPKVSVIIPVKDAAGVLEGCLDSIKRMDYPQDRLEVILADGGSSDASKEIGKRFGAAVLENKKGIVASGRNTGFLNSSGEFIAFTDADCEVSRDWLRNAVRYFKDPGVAGVSGPAITPVSDSSLEKAAKMFFDIFSRLGLSVHKENVREMEYVKDIPGCNSIYRRDALERIMPVDEGLLTAEDVDTNFRLTLLGYKLCMAPDVIVYHRRRRDIFSFWRQMRRFSTGRLQAGKKYRQLLRPAHIIAGVSVPLFLIAGAFLFISNPAVFFLLNMLFLLSLFFLGLRSSRSPVVALDFVLIFFVAMFAWSCGFLRELIFPLRDISGK